MLKKYFWVLILLVNYCSYQAPPTMKRAKKNLKEWRLAKAEKQLQYLVALTKSPESIRLYFKTLLLEGELKKALRLWYAVKNLDVAKDERTMVLAARLYFYLGKQDSSELLAKKIIAFSYSKFKTCCVSRSFNILGLNEFTKANYRKSYFYQKKALAFAVREKGLQQKADALRQIGVLNWYWGKLDEAKSYYEKALKIYRQINDKIGEATTLSNIGLLYFHWKNWLKEFNYNLQALFIRREIGDKIGLADSYYFLSHIPRFNKSVEKFRFKFLKESYNLSREIGYWWGEQVAGNNLIDQFADFNFNEFPFKNDKHFGEGIIFTLFNKTSKLLKEEKYSEAERIYKRVFKIADSLNYDATKFAALFKLAKTSFKLGKIRQAEVFILDAIQLAKSSSKIKYDRGQAFELLARIKLKKNERGKALKMLNNLVSYYDSLYYYSISSRPTSWGYEMGIENISDRRSLVFKDLVELYGNEKKSARLFATLERERELPLWNGAKVQKADFQGVVNFLNLLEEFIDGSPANRETQNKLLAMFNELLSEKKQQEKNLSNFSRLFYNGSGLTLRTFRNNLPPKDVFVEYGYGENSIFALVIKRNKTRIIKIDYNEKKLKDLIVFYLNVLLRGKRHASDELWKEPSEKIYNILLSPLFQRGLIAENDRIIFSPIGSIVVLPLASLGVNKKNGFDFIIGRHPISFAHSAGEYLKNKLSENSRLSTFAAFIPNVNSLKNSLNDIKMPAGLFYDKKIFLNNSATRTNFVNNLMNYDVIHFAGHTEVNFYNPFGSALKFYDGKFLLSDFLRYKTIAKLIVLSSCNSGLVSGVANDLPTSEDYISFPRVLLSGGIKSVLAMLWEANDFAASVLIRRFYSELKPNKNKPFKLINLAKALAKAQNYFIQKDSLKAFRHPFYWSGFYLKY